MLQMFRPKYMVLFVLVFLTITFILIGCTDTQTQIPLHKTDYKQIEKLKDSYAGDNSAMGAIYDELPHREWQKSLEIQEQKIIIDYKNDDESDLNSTFTSNPLEWKKEALTASVLYFFIPQNVEAIKLKANGVEPIEITKADFKEWLTKEKIDYMHMKMSTLVDVVTKKDQVESFYNGK